MNILVVGGHFFNKGAQLMLQTVIEEFNNRSDHVLFVSPCSGTKEQISSLGYRTIDFPLKHVTDYRGFNIFFRLGGILKFLAEKYRGETPMNKIDAVFDISGFAYSDQWGSGALTNVNTLIQYFQKKGVGYYFLPQAFGPFSKESMRKDMAKAIENCKYIAARDKVSYEMLRNVSSNNKIKCYPDITISLGLGQHNFDKPNEDYFCIVPNERMLDQGKEHWSNGVYEHYLKTSINKLLEDTNNKIYIVVHDKGEGDTRLAKDLFRSYETNDRVLLTFEEDPIKLKFILGNSSGLIGSRFHALVSALSQNVPCIALGWSHKYQMLFEEYEIESFSFAKPNDLLFQENLNIMLEESSRETLIKSIKSTNEILKRKNNEMWKEIMDSLIKAI